MSSHHAMHALCTALLCQAMIYFTSQLTVKYTLTVEEIWV